MTISLRRSLYASLTAVLFALPTSGAWAESKPAEPAAPASPAETLRKAFPSKTGALASPNVSIKIVRANKRGPGAGAFAASWVLVAENRSSEVFDQVVLSFNRYSNPNSEISARGLFAPGDQEFWEIPNCDDVNQFAVGLIDNGQLVVSTGDLNRDVADGDWCFDGIGFTD